MGYPNLAAIHQDILDGLKSQKDRLGRASVSQNFWDYEGLANMQVFLRDSETPFDLGKRPYRMAGITRQMIQVLCEHLYSPGPSRTWEKDAGNKFLQMVYEDNHVDALMHRADELSSLNDVAAIQVDADVGKFEDKPITLRLWGGQDFATWCDPDDRTIPLCVCTIDRYEERNVYRLWTDETVTYYEEATGENAGAIRFVRVEKHTYGCLPFSFVHHVQPITTFWEIGIGYFLTQAEIRCNDRMSRIDESIGKHMNPLPVAINVDADWTPIIEPQRFVRINNSKIRPGTSGAYEPGEPPELKYLEVMIDVAGCWDDLTKFLNQVMAAMHVPASAVRMEQDGIASGISLIVEQAPLLTRARKRRQAFNIYENSLARTILRAAGNYYKTGLVNDAKIGKLNLAWPLPTIAVPTKENLELIMEQVACRMMSLLQAGQQWWCIDREAALQQFEQIELDDAELAQRAPQIALWMQAKQEPEALQFDAEGNISPPSERVPQGNGVAKGEPAMTGKGEDQ